MSPRRNEHERAQELLLERNTASLAGHDDSWLQTHLARCADCSGRDDSIRVALQDVRRVSGQIACSRMLVRSAQMRVRERAEEIQQHRERMSPLVIACTLACVWAIGAFVLTWQGFSSLAQTWHLPAALWQASAVLFALAPAALITAIGVAMHREQAG